MKAKLIRKGSNYHVTLGITTKVFNSSILGVKFNFLEKVPYVVEVIDDENDNLRVIDILKQVKTTDHDKFVCSLCGALINNKLDMHNAQPVAPSMCCETCNQNYVVPARLKLTNMK